MARDPRQPLLTWRVLGLTGILLSAVGLLFVHRTSVPVWLGLVLTAISIGYQGKRSEGTSSGLPFRKKLVFAVLTVAGVFGGVEIGLRLAGYRGDTLSRSPLDVYAETPQPFSTSTLPDGTRLRQVAAEGFRSDEFVLPKPTGEIRVFCLGGSTTFGYGLRAEKAYPAVLGPMLAEAFPICVVRTINLGRGGFESFRIAQVVDQVLEDCEPDVLVLHTGHNDFINASRITDFAKIERIVRHDAVQQLALVRSLRSSRVFRLVEDAVWSAQRRFGPAPTEVEYAMHRRAVLREASRAYEENVEAIVRAVRSARVPLVLCTSVSISRDVFPFESAHRPGLTYAVRAEFLERHNRMRHLLMQGQVDQSIRTGKLALALDPSYAQAWYDLGHAYLAKGDADNAAVCFRRARDEDTSGWRAPSRVNRFLRNLATDEGIALADLEAGFRAQSPQGVINRKLFFDSIHFNAAGHRLAAEVIARQVVPLAGSK